MELKKVLTICGVLLAALLLLEIFFIHHHAKYWWHGFIGFDILYGFFGCMLIIIVSKKLGSLFIQKPEDFYGGGEDDAE